MQFSKAAAIAVATVLLQGCGDKEEKKPQQQKVSDFLAKDINTLKESLIAQGQKIRLGRWTNAALNTVGPYIPNSKKVDEYYQKAQAALLSGNEEVHAIFDTFVKNLKGEMKGASIDHFDEVGHTYASNLLNEIHTKGVAATKVVNKNEVEKAAKDFEHTVKNYVGVDVNTHKALQNGMDFISDLVSYGYGMEKNLKDYVDDMHLQQYMNSKEVFAGKSLEEVEDGIKGGMKTFLNKIQDGLTEANKYTTKALEHKGDVIKGVKDKAAELDSMVKKTVQDGK